MRYKDVFFRILRYWTPPLLWMIFIFFLSSRQRIGITQTYIYDFLIFKSLHMVEYAVLFALLFRAFHSLPLPLHRQFLYPVLISILFATSDEIHQLFVMSREGTVRDIIIDTIGIIIMYIVIKKNWKLIKNHL